jgi:hypothetical protein
MAASGLCRTIRASAVILCETVTSSPLTLEVCKDYIQAVLDQTEALAGVRYLDEANADDVWDLSIEKSCEIPLHFRGVPSVLHLEETMLASVAIDQYCGKVTSSCEGFAECKDGLFEALLKNSQVAVISTRLTARQLLDRDGSEIMGARRLQSVWTVNVGFFYVKIVPGLTLTSFSTQVCHGVPPESCRSSKGAQCDASAGTRVHMCMGRRIGRATLHGRRDAGMHPQHRRHRLIGGESARRRRLLPMHLSVSCMR